ncbi:GNAT family N-acetyltransferase [Hoeflea sp. WL0058]|uniref:GNAT family N-acetyltransferase n=1 Tax=Flavimaribacter sediminis TaxID=2865987 RepID=A0AAE2ZLU6_9HYPH|nr:GNAT family N-acetyltransferase [Flavimaribacter sediminis]MBW8637246.1 GNAT family N-acetyltransferase [Flavimaribacter sediminis]
MGISENMPIVRLTVKDIQAGMALSTEAGWNQVADDWKHFIERGETIGVCDADGRLIASAAALPYDGSFGFVGMVLVTADWRRRGIATRLVDRCMAILRSRNLTPVLDATADGEKVYVNQGFQPQFRFDRWQRESSDIQSVVEITTPEPARLDALLSCDAEAFGARRPALMRDFLARDGSSAITDGADGFAIVRRGRRALQAGPVVATSETGALELMKRLLATTRGTVFIDVPQIWSKIGAWLSDQGFTIQRSFARMALGRSEAFGNPKHLFSVAGPEFG